MARAVAASSSAVRARRRAAARKRFRVRVALAGAARRCRGVGPRPALRRLADQLGGGTHDRRHRRRRAEPRRGARDCSSGARRRLARVPVHVRLRRPHSFADHARPTRRPGRLARRRSTRRRARAAASASSAATGGSSCSSSRRGRRPPPIALLRRGGRLRARADRQRRSTPRTARRGSSAAGCTSRSLPAATGRVLDRAAAGPLLVQRSALVLARHRSRCRCGSTARRSRSASLTRRRSCAALADHLGARDARRRPDAPRCRAGGSRSMLDLSHPGELRLGGRPPTACFERLRAEVDRSPRDADFAVRRRHGARRPGAARHHARRPAVGRRDPRRGERPAKRVAALLVRRAAAQAHDRRRRRRWGSRARSARYETFYGGDPNRIHNVQLVAHLVDNKLIAPGATFSFNGTTGERSAAKGFLEAPVIINGELADRPRRRRLPGLDDRLQRRVRGGPADHRADEPRALHLALPARPRRDGQLPRHRPEVRQRHGSLAAPAHVRRARRRSPSPCTGRRSTAASRSTRRAARVVAPPPVRRRSIRHACAGQVVVDDPGVPAQSTSRRAQGLLAGRQAAVRRDVVLELPRRAEDRARRHRRSRRRPKTTTTTTTPTGRDDADDDDGADCLRTSDRSRSATAGRASGAASPRRRSRAPSSRRRSRCLRARSRTRSGSARPSRRRSARARAGGRRIRRLEIAHVRLEHERLDPVVAQALVAAARTRSRYSTRATSNQTK